MSFPGVAKVIRGARLRFDQVKTRSIAETIGVLMGRRVPLYYAHSSQIPNNFGDAINPWLFGACTGLSPVSRMRLWTTFGRPTYFFIGSILDNLNLRNAVVCGSGFIERQASVRRLPSRVIALRGPLSREILVRAGLADCPKVYGDPAILLPLYFQPPTYRKKWAVGIIPHYVDKEIVQRLEIESDGLSYRILDIEGDLGSVVSEICQCEVVLSSSLHGIIAAHAYGVPARWLKFSGALLGGDFKFEDYSLGIGNRIMESSQVGDRLNLREEAKRAILLDVSAARQQLAVAIADYLVVDAASET